MTIAEVGRYLANVPQDSEVRYRSRRDFPAMLTSDAYQEIDRDRTSGIAHEAVSPTSSTINLSTPRLLVMILLLLPGLLFDYLLRRKAA